MSVSAASLTVAEQSVAANERCDDAVQTILFFDGVCGLCNKSVDFVLTRDQQGRIKFSPLQGETAARLLTPADLQDLTGLQQEVLVLRSRISEAQSAIAAIVETRARTVAEYGRLDTLVFAAASYDAMFGKGEMRDRAIHELATPALESKPLTATPLPPVAAKPEAAGPTPAKVEPAAAHPSESALNWSWPTGGVILEPFVEGKNKGVDLAGKVGDPVLAAGDGKVVYAGNGLRGYGNLVIIKHNNDFLSAYAHNSKILVKEGDTVKRGSKIAEVGSSDTDRAKLHFEVRRQGKPVDPTKYLPGR